MRTTTWSVVLLDIRSRVRPQPFPKVIKSIDAVTPRFKRPIDLITLGKEYMVPQWPIEGYKRIIRGIYPSIEVASGLGSEPFYHLMAIRDQYLQTTISPSKGSLSKKGSTNSLKFDVDTKIVELINAGHLEGALPPETPATCETSTDSGTMVDGSGERSLGIFGLLIFICLHRQRRHQQKQWGACFCYSHHFQQALEDVFHRHYHFPCIYHHVLSTQSAPHP